MIIFESCLVSTAMQQCFQQVNPSQRPTLRRGSRLIHNLTYFTPNMYSYGSSARAGVGKRGHGGRPYRPPRKRRDPNSTPPPLKQCDCLIEIHLHEYLAPQPMGRTHACFGGRQAMEQCERDLRSAYQVHLMVPGKKQEGPISMVAKSYREALPALAWLLDQLAINE